MCGASFAGLAVARSCGATGARVLVIDRYEIGERQTSACAVPTRAAAPHGPEGLDPADVRHAGRPHAARQPPLAAAVHLLHLRLPRAVPAAVGAVRRAAFEHAKVRAARERRAHRPRRPRGAAGRGRARLAAGARAPRRSSRRMRRCRAAWRCTRGGRRRPRAVARPKYVPPGYAWSFPAGDEVRVGVGSFDPRVHVKEPTVALSAESGARRAATRATGSPTACATRRRTASSSSATRRGTACRRPPRASAPPCGSASRWPRAAGRRGGPPGRQRGPAPLPHGVGVAALPFESLSASSSRSASSTARCWTA